MVGECGEEDDRCGYQVGEYIEDDSGVKKGKVNVYHFLNFAEAKFIVCTPNLVRANFGYSTQIFVTDPCIRKLEASPV